ncbi:MAG: tail fiber protein [Opitutales bacterium]|nr:tail fiber protein [Opitutales bacterium]
MEYYLGEILTFGFPRAPSDTVKCNGQTMSINQNQALYALLGVAWGGDARSTFGIPNLCGRAMYGLGQAHTNSGVIAGVLDWEIGKLYGTDQYVLSQYNLPMHSHSATFTPTYASGDEGGSAAYVKVSSLQATTNEPNGNYLAQGWDPRTKTADNTYIEPANAGTLGNLAGVGGGTGGMTGGVVTVGNAGSSTPLTVEGPGAGVNFCIVTTGVFPSFD